MTYSSVICNNCSFLFTREQTKKNKKKYKTHECHNPDFTIMYNAHNANIATLYPQLCHVKETHCPYFKKK